MKKAENFIRNTFIFTLSNFSSKILVFLLLPFYTRVLSPEEFGNGDLIIITVTLLIPVFSLCASEGVLRFTLSKKKETEVFMYGLITIIIGIVFLMLLYPLFKTINTIEPYIIYFYLLYISSVVNQYFNNFLRGLEKIKLIGAIGITSTIINISSNILFLGYFKLGIIGYLISYIITNSISALVLFKYGNIIDYISRVNFDKELIRNINRYNLPLIPNRISWWAISTFNRFAIKFFLGMNIVGIYTAAVRIPSIITTLYGIIQQALLLSVVEDFEDNKKFGFLEITYKFLNTILLLIAITINTTIKILAPFLFGATYLSAYKLTPLLVISAFFGALHGNITTVFSAVKNTRVLFINSFIGMILTISLNIILIPILGIYGAGLSSVISYFILWLHLYWKSKKYISLSSSIIKDILFYVLLILQGIIMLSDNMQFFYAYSLVIFLLIIYYKKDIINKIVYLMKNMIYSKIKNISN